MKMFRHNVSKDQLHQYTGESTIEERSPYYAVVTLHFNQNDSFMIIGYGETIEACNSWAETLRSYLSGTDIEVLLF